MSTKRLIGVTVIALTLPLFTALPSYAAATPTAPSAPTGMAKADWGPPCPPRICLILK